MSYQNEYYDKVARICEILGFDAEEVTSILIDGDSGFITVKSKDIGWTERATEFPFKWDKDSFPIGRGGQ